MLLEETTTTKKKLQHTWTTNENIFLRLNGTLEEVRALRIKTINELDKYDQSKEESVNNAYANMTHNLRAQPFTSADNSNTTQGIEELDILEPQPFKYTDHNALDMEHNTDPDNYIFSSNCCNLCGQRLTLGFWTI